MLRLDLRVVEDVVDDVQERVAARGDDLGEALLQIAVVLCSITLFTRNRAYFLLSLGLGAGGIIVAFSALFLK